VDFTGRTSGECGLKMLISGNSIRVIGAAALAIVSFGHVASATTVPAVNYIVNGSFEDGVPGNKRGKDNNALFSNLDTSGPSWDMWTKIRGWTTVKGPGIEVQSNRTLTMIDAQDGTHYVELDSNSNSIMSQKVALSAGKYMLSFWYSPRTSDPLTNAIEYNFANMFGGRVTNGTDGATVGEWTKITSLFTIKSGGIFDLRFAAVGKSDSYGGLLDNIAVSPVPLPAAGFALMAALGGLASVRRRRTV